MELKARIINIYKGIIKSHKVAFNRAQFVSFLISNEIFINLFNVWKKSKDPSLKPSVIISTKIGDRLAQLVDLEITTLSESRKISDQKRYSTLKKRYGVSNPMHSAKIKKKLEQTNLKKYGHKNVFSNEAIKEKIKKTNVKNLGTEYPTQSNLVLEKRVDTYRKKFGVDNPTQNKEIKKKIISSNLKKYGTDNPSKSKQVIDKILKTKEDLGLITVLQGKTLSEWAGVHNKAQAWACKIYNTYGEEAFFDWIISSIPPKLKLPNMLETEVQSLLNLKFLDQIVLKNAKFRPDFKLNDNTYLDIDGLFWHSEALQFSGLPRLEKDHHLKKRKAYEEEGKRVLQIRESELKEKPAIVKSMVDKIVRPETFTRIYARNCEIRILDAAKTKQFLNENHLQGSGHLLKGVFLFHKNQPVMCMTYKKSMHKLENKETYELDRMCSKTYTIVVGGASKLFSFIEGSLHDCVFKTAVDLRYATGDTYIKLGFEYLNESLSFGWTNLKTVIHRLQIYTTKEAKDLGYFRIWDAGQRYYYKRIK